MSVACVSLQDNHTPATATVAVGFGFNCFQFSVERDGKTIEILWSDPAFADGQARPSGSGIPIMFPFPGRIAGGLLRWQGDERHLPQNDGRGNAIHGFVFNRPWRVVEQESDRVVGEFHAARDDASVLEFWPADFRIRAAYALRNARLSCQIEVHNPDQKPLPCGLGTHPYFRLPVGGKSADACVVALPVTAEWELNELLPTGRRLPLANADRFRSGMSFRDMHFDNAFSALESNAGRHSATIFDPESQVRVQQEWDPAFRECVVYTPPHRSAICIEPLTCVPCAMELTARGIDAGLRIIPPGGGFSAAVNINVG